jgi:hypothetical protein
MIIYTLKNVTYVSEHLLLISPVYTGRIEVGVEMVFPLTPTLSLQGRGGNGLFSSY